MIPFVDLKAQYASIKDEVHAAITHVLESGQFVLGSEVAAFEQEFAAYCHSQHGIGVNSGTSALHLALLAAGVGPGDEVITTPFTFVATIAAILYTGAQPVLVDIDPMSFTLDPSKIEQVITNRTRVILPVHLYGQPAAMHPILDIARRYDLIVIEDAAQAHGAEYQGQRVGSLGDMACFSFYPGKNLGAYGEAGIVTTSDAGYAHTIRMLRDWGQSQKYLHDLRGYNYRMDALQGAVLRIKLRHLDAWNNTRRAHAARYNELLAESNIQNPAEMPDCHHVYHIYAIRTAKRQQLQAALYQQGIHTGIHYPAPVHLLPAYADLGYRAGDFPAAEQAAREVLSLPMYAELTDAQLQQIAQAIQTYSS